MNSLIVLIPEGPVKHRRSEKSGSLEKRFAGVKVKEKKETRIHQVLWNEIYSSDSETVEVQTANQSCNQKFSIPIHRLRFEDSESIDTVIIIAVIIKHYYISDSRASVEASDIKNAHWDSSRIELCHIVPLQQTPTSPCQHIWRGIGEGIKA